MKQIKKLLLSLCIVFTCCIIEAQNGVHPKCPAGHEKLKHDKASFELFKTLVFLYGLENERIVEKGNACTFYDRHYNFLHPYQDFLSGNCSMRYSKTL